MNLRWTLLLLQLGALWLVCMLQTVSNAQQVDSPALDGAVATDVDEASSAATAPLRYVFYPTYQPIAPPSPASLNYSLVPFNVKLGTRRVTGRVLTVHSSPHSHFSVYPPPGGCGGGRRS